MSEENKTDPAVSLLSQLINPEALKQLIVEAARRGDVKVTIPGDVVKKLLGDQSKLAAEMIAKDVSALALQLAQKISRNIEIKVPDRKPVVLRSPHKQTQGLIRLLETLRPNMRNILLVGPAGSGKTTAADQAAQALGFVEAYIQGQVITRYEFDGFVDAHGVYRPSLFRRFAESEGGVFLQDEIDSSEPAALLALNAYLANGRVTFPDGKTFKRTERHYVIAAANTFGSGSSRLYVGRNQLDAATTDRYRTYIWEYDEELEAQLVGNEEWHARVKSVRRAVDKIALRHTITPRDAMRGADEIAGGSTIAEQEIAQLKRGLTDADWAKVVAASK